MVFLGLLYPYTFLYIHSISFEDLILKFHLNIPIYLLKNNCNICWDSLVAQRVKSLPAMWETWVWSLGWEDPLEKKTATQSSSLAWKIPWMEKPGGLQSQRVRHDWATSLLLHVQLCSVFSKSPVNVLLYFHNLKDRKVRGKKKVSFSSFTRDVTKGIHLTKWKTQSW